MRTCGDCRHFKPNVNPRTGRVRPTYRGECAWPFQWPESWPMAYSGVHGVNPQRPSSFPVGSWSGAESCVCFEANVTNKTTQTATQVALPIG